MRGLTALLLVLAAAPAVAGTGESEFVLAVESQDVSVAVVVGGLEPIVRDAWEHLEPGDWDVAVAGPFDLVHESARVTLRAPLPDRVVVTVDLDVAPPVPSEAASADALALRLLAAVQRDVEARIERWRKGTVGPQEDAASSAHALLKLALADDQRLTEEWGDIDAERRIATSRLNTASEGLAEARVDRAVAAARLEVARTAVERAAEVEDVRREISALEDGDVPQPVREQQLAELRDRLSELERKAPPLESARQRVFDLEVEMVGLEARLAALEPELAAVRERVSKLAEAHRAAEDLRIRLAAARAEVAASERLLREATAQAARVQCVVLERPATPRKAR